MSLTPREPVRLILSDSTDEFTQRLLQSADVDRPKAHALGEATARLTELLAAGHSSVVAPRTTEVAAIMRGRRVRPEKQRITRAAGIGILLGTSLAAAVVGVTHTAIRDQPASVSSAELQPVPPAKRLSRTSVRPRERLAETPEQSAPNPEQPREPRPSRSLGNDLGRELSLMDSARAALSKGNPTSALRTLDEAARLKRRVLAPEATVLRVRALVALDRTVEARRIATAFVAQSPDSPVSPVLRDLVAPLERPRPIREPR